MNKNKIKLGRGLTIIANTTPFDCISDVFKNLKVERYFHINIRQLLFQKKFKSYAVNLEQNYQSLEHTCICEAPETGLDIESILEVAKRLVALSNHGLKLLIITRNDMFIKRINSLIMASKLPNSTIKEFGFRRYHVLNPKTLRAYSYNGKQFKALKIADDGFDVGEIDKQIDLINHESMRLYSGLVDRK